MSKFVAPKLAKNQTRTRTSFRLPSAMLDRMHESMTTHGYSLKQRSLWLNEAISELTKKEFSLLVLEDFLYPGKNEKIPLTVSREAASNIELIEQTIKTTEQETPALGAILRTAALQRLMSETRVPTRDESL